MIKLVNVSKYYNTNNVVALGLRKINLELYRNEFIAIVGESGSGKTTLLNVISGIDSYEDGEMYINGEETSYFSVSDMENYRKKYIAFVFQNYNLIDSYTVLQNVEAPLILSGYPKEKIHKKAREIIKRVGLEDHINHKATKLSGGQKQRVVIARALAKDCPIIAADEPTGNLDSKSAKQIIDLLYEISKEKLVIIVTHDFSQVEKYATRKIRIYDGEIVEDINLKKVEKLNLPTIPDEEHQIKFIDYLKISMRNLLAVPKKSLLMLLVFTFFSFFVALSYGAYQLAMQEVSYNNNYSFTNTNPNRIILKKTDNSVFTTDDLLDLADYNLVGDIVSNDYILDIRIELISTDNLSKSMAGLLLPINLIEESNLDYGVMPSNKNEIIIATSKDIIDRNHDELLTQDYQMDFETTDDIEKYNIVGLIDVNKLVTSPNSYGDSYLLVTDELMDELRVKYYFNYAYASLFISADSEISVYFNSSMTYDIDNSLQDNEMRISASYMTCNNICTVDGSLDIKDYYVDNSFSDFTFIFDKSVTKDNVVYMNQNTYDRIFYDDIYQVSLLTNTDVGVTNLVKILQHIQKDGIGYKYKVIYPYDSEASAEFEGLLLLMMNIGFIVLIFVTLVGSTLITYVIFKAIINTKLHDYAIFRTIGANKKVIKSFIYIENLLIVVISYIILVTVTLSLPLSITQRTPLEALKIYKFSDFIVFFILLIIMSLVISRKYCNRIFKETVQSTLKSDME